MAEARREAVEAQDAQMILRDARRGVADEGDAARIEIGETIEPVVDRPCLRIGVERVDREVAPRSIVAPVVGESDASRGGRRFRHRGAAVVISW